MVEKNQLLMKYIEGVKKIYGSNIDRIILFGSFARGEQREDSDIDIMILLKVSDEEAKKYQKELFDVTYDFNMDNDVEINPMAHNVHLFEKWVDAVSIFLEYQKRGSCIICGIVKMLELKKTYAATV